MPNSKSKKTSYGNNLNMNKVGNARPEYPSIVLNDRHDKITLSATKLSSAPLIYLGSRVNELGSSMDRRSLAIMKFGNYSLHDVFGNKVKKGQLMPNKVREFNIKVNNNGKYSLVNLNSIPYKICRNRYENYIKYD